MQRKVWKSFPQIFQNLKQKSFFFMESWSHSHPFHEMPKLWADESRAGVARVHVQPSTLYQDGGGGGDDGVSDGVLVLGRWVQSHQVGQKHNSPWCPGLSIQRKGTDLSHHHHCHQHHHHHHDWLTILEILLDGCPQNFSPQDTVLVWFGLSWLWSWLW